MVKNRLQALRFLSRMSRRGMTVLLAGLLMASTTTSEVRAQTWEGDGADAMWDTAANWDGDNVPDTAETATFGEAGATFRNNTNNRALANLASLTGIVFANVPTIAAADQYTLNAAMGSAGFDAATP